MPEKPKIIVILGPTASGKSALSVKLAKKFNGEIISADSRQVYRGMDIGTGKVPLDKKCNRCRQSGYKNRRPLKNVTGANAAGPAGCYQGIPHYLLDVASPKRRFTVARYQKLARAAIKKILRQNKIPILCGGTGFYIQALVDNISIPEVKPDFKLRAQLEKKSVQELFKELKKLDSNRAKTIDPHNPRRLIRALEIIYKSGKPVPPLNLKNPPHPSFSKGGSIPPFVKGGLGGILFDPLFIGVKKSPVQLKKLIRKRLLKRLKQGMIKEVKNLRKSGLSWRRLEEFGLEYRWLARYLQKKISYQEMIGRLQKDTEHFAKRQMTWFGRWQRQGVKIYWLTNSNRCNFLVKNFLKK